MFLWTSIHLCWMLYLLKMLSFWLDLNAQRPWMTSRRARLISGALSHLVSSIPIMTSIQQTKEIQHIKDGQILQRHKIMNCSMMEVSTSLKWIKVGMETATLSPRSPLWLSGQVISLTCSSLELTRTILESMESSSILEVSHGLWPSITNSLLCNTTDKITCKGQTWTKWVQPCGLLFSRRLGLK